MADALRQSSQQANQMTAAALPYQREGGGANVVPAAMQGAQAMQGILLNQAEAEVRMRDVGIRHQLLNMELQTRSMLAPLQVQEAAARLETLKLNKQIQEFELGQQRMSYDMMPAIGTEESGYQVAVGPGRYEDADMSNPRHVQAVQRAQMSMLSAGQEFRSKEADINATRAKALRDLREPGNNLTSAMVGAQRNALDEVYGYRQMLSDRAVVNDDEAFERKYGMTREKAKQNMQDWAARGEGFDLGATGSGDGPGVRMDADLAATVGSSMGMSGDAAADSIGAVASILGESPDRIAERIVLGTPEAEDIKKLLAAVARARQSRK